MADLVLPEDYPSVLAGLTQRVREARYQAQRQVNTQLIQLNWQIGRVSSRPGGRNGATS